MDEEIANKIALHQMNINELKALKKRLTECCSESMKFIIQTKEFDPFSLGTFKRKHKLDVSPRTMELIVNEAIIKERARIDELIDNEVERKMPINITKKKPVVNTKNDTLCIQFIKTYLNETDEPNCFFQTLYEKCKTYCEKYSSEMISRKRLSLCLKQLGCVIKSKKNLDNVSYRYVWFDDIII